MQEEGIQKCPTGILGLDEILEGGLPRGRSTLICGNAGCGKTVLATLFLFNGITRYDEPGVFIAFEERTEDLIQNFLSMGMDLKALIEDDKLRIDYVRVESNEIEETGDYSLDGLFIRLNQAIDAIGAKRVVLDTLDVVFSELRNPNIVRSELKRLLEWLKKKDVTAIVTGERGSGTLSRYGMEEYVADCVIDLEHMTEEQIATRRMKVIKYRGSTHGTNEYPFLIDNKGIAVFPITSLRLEHAVSSERVSTGIPTLDAMLGGQGVYRGSSVLVSGYAGAGKTSIGASFIDAACRRGEKCLWIAFEESPEQLKRNMSSIGMDLGIWADKGLLTLYASRPTIFGLEMHLVSIIRLVDELDPSIVVIDPISNLVQSGRMEQSRGMLTRLIDYMKSRMTTAVFTSLITSGPAIELGQGISSLMDTWLLIDAKERNGERTRGLYILKSRGMSHSNQVREFVLNDEGVALIDVYVGPEGVLTGSMRTMQEERDKAEELIRKQKAERLMQDLERKRIIMERQLEEIKSEFEDEKKRLEQAILQESLREQLLMEDRHHLASMRQANEPE